MFTVGGELRGPCRRSVSVSHEILTSLPAFRMSLSPDLEGQSKGRGEGRNPLQLGNGFAGIRFCAGSEMGDDLLKQSLDLGDSFVHGRAISLGRCVMSRVLRSGWLRTFDQPLSGRPRQFPARQSGGLLLNEPHGVPDR